MSDKVIARRDALARRCAMRHEEVSEASRRIAERLLALPEYVAARAIYAYLDAGNEVETRAIVLDALGKGKVVYCPRVDGAVLHWHVIEHLDVLVSGAFGIHEPPHNSPTSAGATSNELCLVPGVAFRRDGHRLGRGGGHYDRFLATFLGISVALAYDWQVRDDFTQEAHDVPVRIILTEARALRV